MLSFFKINGKLPMHGGIKVQGSKNAVLPMMAASVLNKGITVIKNVPMILDVCSMIHILRELGCVVKVEGDCVTIDSSQMSKIEIPEEWVGKMRSSIILLGPLLSRFHQVKTFFPGGCSIGKRPIDLHLTALELLGATFTHTENEIIGMTKQLVGNEITFSFPSVGATENAIMASVCAKGTTIIKNGAREPEVVQLCLFLNAMGAKISGMGTSTIKIQGVTQLHDVEFTNGGDRIVAATILAGAAICGGEVFIEGVKKEHLLYVLDALEATGCQWDSKEDMIHLKRRLPLKPIKQLVTAPYPGFPTDCQSQMMAVLTLANGVSTIEETVFEGRFNTANELKKMGADIIIEAEKKRATILGVKKLTGATVNALDLRGGAALVLAGLAADGVTYVTDCHHILRGYAHFAEDLRNLGMDITLLEEKQ